MAYRQRFGRYGRFSLSWPWNDLLDVTQGQGHCGFWIIGTKFLLVSLSNYGSISHRLGAMDPQSFCYRRTTDNRQALSDKGDAARGVALKNSILLQQSLKTRPHYLDIDTCQPVSTLCINVLHNSCMCWFYMSPSIHVYCSQIFYMQIVWTGLYTDINRIIRDVFFTR